MIVFWILKVVFFYLIKDRFTLPDSTLEYRFSYYYLGTETKYKIENSNIIFTINLKTFGIL